jgi:predicted Zn-dependent protease
MGQLYFRQEKYDVALVHFKSAALVNPQSSVLRCYWGMALAKQNILGNALTKLQGRRGRQVVVECVKAQALYDDGVVSATLVCC